MMLADLLNGGAPDQTSGIGGGGPSAVAPISVNAPPANSTNTDFNRSAYNNLPDIQMAQQGQKQDPQHTGLFGVKGTLRNVLGILGDAMLVQSGHTPVYSQRIQQEREADAMTGFQSNPDAAAGRLAAIPGAADMAAKLHDTSETHKLREETQKSNDTYRQAREDALADQERSRQDIRDARMRQGVGGILSAAATPDPKTGVIDPQRWAAARAQALKFGSKISDFDPSEIPDTADQYNAGYGQTARQVAQGQTSNASIQERAAAASQNSADRIRGQDIGAQGAAARNATAQRDTDVRDATARRGQDMKGNKLHIPGLTTSDNKPSNTGSQFVEGHVYHDAQGNKATYSNGKWIPVQ